MLSCGFFFCGIEGLSRRRGFFFFFFFLSPSASEGSHSAKPYERLGSGRWLWGPVLPARPGEENWDVLAHRGCPGADCLAM